MSTVKDLNKYVSVYKEQLKKGDILIAYNELVKFVMNLRTDFINDFANQYSFTGILHGYLDYTYFYYTNDFLKSKKLKLGLVLNHLEMRFEIWLLGNTKVVQKEYWELLKSSKWNEDRNEMPKYSIIETSIIKDPNFNDLNNLKHRIEENMSSVSNEILNYLKELD